MLFFTLFVDGYAWWNNKRRRHFECRSKNGVSAIFELISFSIFFRRLSYKICEHLLLTKFLCRIVRYDTRDQIQISKYVNLYHHAGWQRKTDERSIAWYLLFHNYFSTVSLKRQGPKFLFSYCSCLLIPKASCTCARHYVVFSVEFSVLVKLLFGHEFPLAVVKQLEPYK